MKRNIFITTIAALTATVLSSFTVPTQETTTSDEPLTNGEQMITVTTDANGYISSAEAGQYYETCWQITDLSGPTNIRNKPSGKVCMKLKAHTQYNIYTNGAKGSWLNITRIYNLREGYWVRLHSSSTGTYWISSTVLFRVN